MKHLIIILFALAGCSDSSKESKPANIDTAFHVRINVEGKYEGLHWYTISFTKDSWLTVDTLLSIDGAETRQWANDYLHRAQDVSEDLKTYQDCIEWNQAVAKKVAENKQSLNVR